MTSPSLSAAAIQKIIKAHPDSTKRSNGYFHIGFFNASPWVSDGYFCVPAERTNAFLEKHQLFLPGSYEITKDARRIDFPTEFHTEEPDVIKWFVDRYHDRTRVFTSVEPMTVAGYPVCIERPGIDHLVVFEDEFWPYGVRADHIDLIVGPDWRRVLLAHSLFFQVAAEAPHSYPVRVLSEADGEVTWGLTTPIKL